MSNTVTPAPQARNFAPTRVLQIELSEPLPAISSRNDKTGVTYRQASVLVRLHTQPLGLVELPLGPDGVQPEGYAPLIWQALGEAINRHLAEDGLPAQTSLAAPLSAAPCLAERERFMEHAPAASVIVATHDRPESLEICLNALAEQAYPRFELIIVDNAPTSRATADLVARYRARFPRLRYIREDHPNLSLARNRGVAVAQGEIVAFTDDDTVPDRYWLAEMARGFQAGGNVACVTGLVLPKELETPPQVWFESYGGFSKGFRPQLFDLAENRAPDPLYPYAAGKLGTGASCAFRTSILRRLGGFDPAIGIGSLALNADDLDMFVRVILAGYQVAYRPAALILHAHRAGYPALRRQIYTYGVGLAALLAKCMAQDPMLLLRLLRKVPYGLYYVLSPRSPKNKKRVEGYPADLVRAELSGLLYGALTLVYLRSRRRWQRISASVLSAQPKNAWSEDGLAAIGRF